MTREIEFFLCKIRNTYKIPYIDARMQVYVPAYKWVLENKAVNQVEKIREWSKDKIVVLLDYNTNEDLQDASSALSHAAMIKAYIEGRL